MAALQPALFPDLNTADFYQADELDEVAASVIHLHGHAGSRNPLPRLGPVVEAIEAGEIRVLYLMNGKPLADTEDPGHHDVAGKCVKAPALWHDVTGYDVAIWIREAIWKDLPPDARRAIVLHELLHVEVTRDKDDQAKVSVRKHDVEDFVDVARHYGPIAGEGARYVRAAAAFAGQPEPMDPRRPVAAGDLHTAVIEATVDAVNRGELGPDVSIERDVSRFAGLVLPEESLDQAYARLERRGDFTEVMESDAGQLLLKELAQQREIRRRTVRRGGRDVDPETGEILDGAE